MKFASFAKLRELETVSALGFDGVELDSCELRRLDDGQFDALIARMRALGLEACMGQRKSWGGPAPEETARQIQSLEAFIRDSREASEA